MTMEHAAAEGANIFADQPCTDHGIGTTTHEVDEVRGGYHPPTVRRMNYFDADTILQFADNSCPFIEGMHLHVANLDFTDNRWVEIVGRAIGRSEHLRRLELLDDVDEPANNTSLFFNLIAANRSIEHLVLGCFDHDSLDIFDVLAQFVMDNHNLRGFEVVGSDISLRIPSLISALMLETMTNRLQCIELTNCGIREKQAEVLLNALRANSGLNKLLQLGLGGNMIGVGGCVALCNLLTEPSCKIHSLDITDNDLNDDCIGTLSNALAFHKNTVKVLNVGSQGGIVASWGFETLSKFLSGSSCMLEKLQLVLVGDGCAHCLGDSLAANNSLKHIDFRSSTEISIIGWLEISKCLQAPNSVLVQLNLRDCGIVDQGAIAICTALAQNVTLKKLDMSENRTITPDGWVRSFLILNHTSCTLDLDELTLDDNNIEYPAAALLVSMLTQRMIECRSLSLLRNDSMSFHGWFLFNIILTPSSSSKLQKLHIGTELLTERSINDTLIIGFANSLAKNTRLKELDLGCTNISENGWYHLFEAFCDKSSVDSICFNSNHTLTKLTISPQVNLPHPISAMVHVNGSSTETSEVARLKVNLCYFSDINNASRVFGSMEVTLLPHAIGWIGRDSTCGPTALYHLVHSTPALLAYI